MFGFWLLDTIYSQYLVSLGFFDNVLDNMEKDVAYEKFVILFFGSATFYTQLTMLNMLIAIMGDSFD